MNVRAFSPLAALRSRHSPLPGLGLSLGVTTAYLGLLVVLPLSALVVRAAGLGVDGLWRILSQERVASAFRVSFTAAAQAALLDLLFGALIAWVLVRYRFAGRRLFDALVDLPFALPTAVAGIALTTLYAPRGWLGAPLSDLGIRIAYTPLGIVVALAFVGLPFVVRTIQPVLAELEVEQEEAAATLGASRLQTVRRVIFPALVPALLTGFTLSFARGLGEYGSVIFIAGNLPRVSEIVPLLIVIRLEQFDYRGAAAIAAAMLAASFLLLLAINLLQGWSRRRHAA